MMSRTGVVAKLLILLLSILSDREGGTWRPPNTIVEGAFAGGHTSGHLDRYAGGAKLPPTAVSTSRSSATVTPISCRHGLRGQRDHCFFSWQTDMSDQLEPRALGRG
ncbi:uncharacterized protein YALI1_C17514g [Yarrowia lipolytica]|uniref:Secreted protein n=1 Tax=Yarrowia lipolytica TaxID=4952 RepID=A0A1D8NAV4_YARLL|nr:hypothetical protein YALI1_C17514g [Yarrowia lipolytica]